MESMGGINNMDLNEKYDEYISNLFNLYKRKNVFDPMICFPIINDKEEIIGLLKPIPFDYRRMYPESITLLGKWREENPSLSNSVFVITNERTENWLDNLILKRKDRILFYIDDLSNCHLGHIAFSSFDFQNMTAEIDCVLRGRKNILPGIMTFAVHTMVRIAFDKLKLKKLYLVTNEDNIKAIQLYERCGFHIIDRIPLFRRELENEVRWDADEIRDVSEAERFEVKMVYGDKAQWEA